MSNRLKTTVYLDRADYSRLKSLALRRKTRPAELVREAIAEYTARNEPEALPGSLGLGRSGAGDVAERAEELLAGMGEDE